MKTIPSSLATLFASGNAFNKADCYTFYLINGSVYKLTSYDSDVVFGSDTWSCSGPILSRGTSRIVLGLEVGTMEITASPHDADLIGAQSWFQAVCSGVMDGATVSVDRAFFSIDGECAGLVNVFYGNIAQTVIDRAEINFTVNTPLDALNIQMPRNLYQTACQHTLFDVGCGASRAAFTSTGSVTDNISRVGFDSDVGGQNGRYNLGALQFTSGVLEGTKRTVKTWDGFHFILLNPLPLPPAAGDTFQVTAGCDKTLTKCNELFLNKANYKGWPFVPIPETAL